ncbi:MAG: endopeptidase La [Rhodobacteraceae bacterium]|nr:endopeptidase La [Paracoccaceae bacterium]
MRTKVYPILPLRDTVVFPNMICPLFVGREKSVRSLDRAVENENGLVLVAQKEVDVDDPGPEDLFGVGVAANILQLLKLPNGTMKLLVEGGERIKIRKFVDSEDCIQARTSKLPDELDEEDEAETMLALSNQVLKSFQVYANRLKLISDDGLKELANVGNPSKLADVVASHLNVSVEKKQGLLELANVKERLEQVLRMTQEENNVAIVEKKLKRRVKSQISRTQREYYLHEQMKAIQRELGDAEEKSEIEELEERIAATELSDEAREKAGSELNKLKSMGNNVSEATVIRNYLDWMLSIPWGVKREVKKDLSEAEIILDEDHYGLERVKERIIEYIAVQQRTEKISGPILCLVGPPGVGKTSLGESAARATGRDFLRIALGGVSDEAEIRGHRRTYIGSMPGRIIQTMKKGNSVNPLILLDEVDKLGQSFRGDPASALLEVLDPEQNAKFVDHYLDVDYDLSDVMFITTANYLEHIPEPLRDRMEIISLAGYTEDEKIEIAKRHLVPKQRKSHGIKSKEFKITDQALERIVRVYTREAGVRNMEREIAKLARKTVRKLVKQEIKSVVIGPKKLEEHLGVAKFRYGLAEESDQVGIVTGLAWSSAGGDLLSIEALVLPGKGRVMATGKLGAVMKESIDAASSYVRSISPKIGFRPTGFEKIDIHVHVPEGATPKEGPSAGVAMVTSIVSVLSKIPVRRDIAMTGEITLRGNVLPIGGLKSKLLAATRGGISTVLIPEKNMKDLSEISDDIKGMLDIRPVSHVTEVLKHALVRKPEPIEWNFELDSPDVPTIPAHVESPSMSQH